MRSITTDVEQTLLAEKVIAILRCVCGPRVEAIVEALRRGGVRFIAFRRSCSAKIGNR